MTRNYLLSILLISTFISLKTVAQENKVRFFSVGYHQRIHFVSFQSFATIQDASLPKLLDNSRFHGLKLQGAFTENIIIGLYSNGTLNHKKNNEGYTSLGGGIGVFSLDYRYAFSDEFYSSVGFGLGCGMFTYSSTFWNGDKSILSQNDAIFGEPTLNIGYIFKKKLILAMEVTNMITIVGNNYYVGNGNGNGNNAFSKGWFIGASIGYQFPFIDNFKK